MKPKHRKAIAIAVAVLLAAFGIMLLFRQNTLRYGLILLGAVVLAFLVWKAFVRNPQAELDKSEEARRTLEGQVADLKRELDELSHSPLNVTGLTPVLHLSTLNIDTSFTRTYVREDADRGLIFTGALRADICAEYGIRLEDVKFRYDDSTGTLWLAGFEPGLLSFSKKQLQWDIAQTRRTRSVLGIKLPPMEDKAAEEFTRLMKENIRSEVEKEIDRRRIAEFEWLAPIVSRQVTDVLCAAIGHPDAHVSILADSPAPAGFLSIEDFSRTNQKN